MNPLVIAAGIGAVALLVSRRSATVPLTIAPAPSTSSGSKPDNGHVPAGVPGSGGGSRSETNDVRGSKTGKVWRATTIVSPTRTEVDVSAYSSEWPGVPGSWVDGRMYVLRFTTPLGQHTRTLVKTGGSLPTVVLNGAIADFGVTTS